MPRIALKIDVDTDQGTATGALRLARALESRGIPATFLFSVGPDHTGRALRRVFRRGFIGKVRRTSVLKHYGARTLLYGTLLPGPHIGRRRADVMRGIAGSGFEVGVHAYDHVKWQDGVAAADEHWTRRQLVFAIEEFGEIFGRGPIVHGAAGWQLNAYVPGLQEQLGFTYASDTRGTHAFLPMVNGVVYNVPQLPTTLPTLDELLGREDVPQNALAAHLQSLVERSGTDQVFTLHAELEGGEYLQLFLELIDRWRASGFVLEDLAAHRAALRESALPVHEMAMGQVEGRSGWLAVQGPAQAAGLSSTAQVLGPTTPSGTIDLLS
jgi:peptidoglycan/xylan/chitin deacetylase (PgdA/CDA1 family)